MPAKHTPNSVANATVARAGAPTLDAVQLARRWVQLCRRWGLGRRWQRWRWRVFCRRRRRPHGRGRPDRRRTRGRGRRRTGGFRRRAGGLRRWRRRRWRRRRTWRRRWSGQITDRRHRDLPAARGKVSNDCVCPDCTCWTLRKLKCRGSSSAPNLSSMALR